MEQLYIFEQASRAANYGVGMYVKQLSTCMQHTGREVNVVYLSSKEKTFQVKYEGEIRSFYIPAVRESELIDKKKTQDRYYRCAVYLLLPYINKDSQLLFHINYNHSLSLVETVRDFWPASKVLLSVHYLEWCFLNRGDTAAFRNLISDENKVYTDTEKQIKKIYDTEKQLFESVDHIICLSQYAKQSLQQDYHIDSNKLSLIYNGLEDTSILLNEEEKSSLKQQFHIDAEEKIILFAGRLDDIKGISYLIQAFKVVLEKNKNCTLVIAGDGDFAENMRHGSEIWNKVIFTGKLPKEQLYKMYQISDIGVMPSMHEQCSYVAIEMMMHGIPLIASDSTGLDEMVIDGENGCKLHLLKSEEKVEVDVLELSSKIEYLLELDKCTLSRLKTGSRKMYEKRYLKQRMTDLYNQTYKSNTVDNIY